MPVFNGTFFFCMYQLSLLLLLESVTLPNIEILQRICKGGKKGLSVCSLLFLRSEMQKCSSCSCVSSSHFLLEIDFFCLSCGHCCNGLFLAYSLWSTAVYYALCHICVRIWPNDIMDEWWEEQFAGESQVILDQLVVRRSDYAAYSFFFWCICICFKPHVKRNKRKKVFIQINYLICDGFVLYTLHTVESVPLFLLWT